ncbi:MAG: NADH-quinone oxidoreductase subunit J [Frankia sp.]
MNTTLVAATEITRTGSGEQVVFWILAPIAVLAAFGMVLARNAVHGALMLIVDLFCLAIFFMLQSAPFLGFVQIIVYAGAIMVLFLFVLMLIGVDTSDSLVETLRGQRAAAIVLGIGFAGLIALPIIHVISGTKAAGLSAANNGGNVQALAKLLFTTYVFPFEIVSALLIIAAIGAMVLGHQERTGPKVTQREMLKRRFASTGPLTPRPGPGVRARADAVDTPALLPDGRPALTSIAAEYGGAAEEEPAVPVDRLDRPDDPEGDDPEGGGPEGGAPAGDNTPVGAGSGGSR